MTPTPTPIPTATPTITPTPIPTPTDREVAARQLSEIIPGFGVGGEWNGGDLAQRLLDLWLRDTDAATDVAELPWVTDGIERWDAIVLGTLMEIAKIDTGIAQRVAVSTWMKDSVTDDEWRGLKGLNRFSSNGLAAARTVTGYSWFADDLNANEWRVLVNLGSIASKGPELALSVVALPWFADGVTLNESTTLFYLDDLASTHLGIAETVVGLPWFTDSKTENDWVSVAYLNDIASQDLDLAHLVMNVRSSGDLVNLLLQSLGRSASLAPDALRQIADQPWVQDGLDEEEMAFMVALLGTAGENKALFTALLEGHYTQQSKTASLPLAGDVNIWVFQSSPVSSKEDIPTVIEDIVRAIEGFVGAHLPITDIVLLIENLPQDLAFPWYGGLHQGTHITLYRQYGEDLEQLMPAITHELAHYYLFGPPWFFESFAHLMEGYVNQKMGIQSMAAHRAEASLRVQRSCSDEEIATIRHSLFVDQHFRILNPDLCTRALGLSFLHQVFEIMGEERISTALRGLYALDESKLEESLLIVDEEAIYHGLLSNTPPDRHEEFRDLYRRLHGGPYADPDIDPEDDYGDTAETATEVATEQVLEGALDYRFDFDYFRLQAKENQKFRFDVDHETLRADNVMVFASTGKRSLGVKDKAQVSSGTLVQWVAPSTGTYYFAILSLRGETGRYTLRITPVPDVPDDHGDAAATATEIKIGETVRGITETVFDLDYFRFPVVAGRFYSVKITGLDCCVAFGRDDGGFVWGDGNSFAYQEVSSGERHIVVHGGHETTGAYALEVSSE